MDRVHRIVCSEEAVFPHWARSSTDMFSKNQDLLEHVRSDLGMMENHGAVKNLDNRVRK